MTTIPFVKEAEDGVIADVLRDASIIPDLTSNAGLRYDDFYSVAHQLVWKWAVEAFYADEPVDAITVGANLSSKLKAAWACPEQEVVGRLQRLVASSHTGGKASTMASLIRKASDQRRLLELAANIQASVERGEDDPLVIAGKIAADASKVATGIGSKKTTLSYDETGQVFLEALDQTRKAHDRGARMGVWTGIKGIDDVTSGLKPGEVMVLAGAPGEGKSGLVGRAALNFAKEQAPQPKGDQLATLILSMEMGAVPFGTRVAQMVAQADTSAMRSGRMSDFQFERIRNGWGALRGLPLFIDYTNNPKLSQVRAVVAEAVRRHNVGFVVLDHFKTMRLDQRAASANDEDEDKITFIKYQLAQEMNVAVIVLAHTRKVAEGSGGRPSLSDLRGSGQISAHADFVNFLYRPYKYASQNDKDNLRVSKTDAEIIWGKVRFGEGADTDIHLDLETMDAR